MLTHAGWYVLAGAAVIAAAVAVLGRDRRHRQAGLLITVLAGAGLLVVLGADLAALAWLGLGAGLARLPQDQREHPATALATAEAPRRATVRSWFSRLAAALPAIGVGVLLVAMAGTVDWRDLPPPSAVPQTAEVGGLLLTVDVALLLGAALLLANLLVAAAWILARSTAGAKGS
jgi:hypothetical protein